MTINSIIQQQTRPFPSLEIVPPLKGVTKEALTASVRPFMEFRPPFINVTSHRDEFEFRQLPDGTFERHIVRRRVSETAVCAALQAEFPDVEIVPHLICAGAGADGIEHRLQDFKFLGINNIMALRGDSLIGEKRFSPEPGGYGHASELVAATKAFNPDFCVGVGGYPEKHFEAPNMETDIANLKLKVDAGAGYIITQMFFDNSVFYDFCDRCRRSGITVPIIPGLKPLSSASQIQLVPEAFAIDLPQDLVVEMKANAGNKEACYRIGQEWCEAQVKDLLAHGVPAVHFYTMGRPDNVTGILRKLF